MWSWYLANCSDQGGVINPKVFFKWDGSTVSHLAKNWYGTWSLSSPLSFLSTQGPTGVLDPLPLPSDTAVPLPVTRVPMWSRQGDWLHRHWRTRGVETTRRRLISIRLVWTSYSMECKVRLHAWHKVPSPTCWNLFEWPDPEWNGVVTFGIRKSCHGIHLKKDIILYCHKVNLFLCIRLDITCGALATYHKLLANSVWLNLLHVANQYSVLSTRVVLHNHVVLIRTLRTLVRWFCYRMHQYEQWYRVIVRKFGRLGNNYSCWNN